MLWPRSDRLSSPKNLGKKHLIWSTDDKSLHVCSFHYESKKNMNMSEQLSAQLMDKVGPAWQSHSRIRTCRRRLSWSANRVPCGVMSIACGPWLLGPICQWLWGGHNCWEFCGEAEALFPTTCWTQWHHRVGRGAHWPTGSGLANRCCTLIHNENFKLV